MGGLPLVPRSSPFHVPKIIIITLPCTKNNNCNDFSLGSLVCQNGCTILYDSPNGSHPLVQQDLNNVVNSCVMSLEDFTLPCTKNNNDDRDADADADADGDGDGDGDG